MASNAGLDWREISGTGPGGKIMKSDVTLAASAPASPETGIQGARRVPLSPMRKVIATRMVESLFSAPHYYMSADGDMTEAIKFREQPLGFKPSFNDIILHAVVRAIRQHPLMNARWAEDAIEENDDINLGVAVALPAGLVVPVLRRAQDMSLEGIHHTVKAMADKARAGKLTPDDYSGSTFTVTNLGVFGVDQFTAIINQPNSAILAVGRIAKKPVVIDDGIHIRSIATLTISSDHRVIDGAVAAQFMATLRTLLE